MPTKLNRICLGIMEAAWLAAVSIVPIFFNIYSSRIFEPDKITILRSLALLTLAAWAIKLIDDGGIRWREKNSNESLIKYLWKYPLIAPVIGLVIVYSLSTIFSVTPSISLLGSWQRLQGTYTTFSYLIIFLSIIANLRKREQVNRLITTVIIASLPISLYGLLQRYQIDPIPWGGNVSVRIAANMGNSIFVAAYLIMVFPLTVGRILDAFKAILSENEANSEKGDNSLKHIVLATIYVFIAALELIAIYMSGSRGPLLGLMAGIYFMVLLFSVYWRKKWLTFSAIGAAILGAAFLAVFNMSNGPLEALKNSPAIGRFGNLLNPESNSALVRKYIWEGTVKLVGIHDPLKFPDGTTDKFNILRPIIGYGPETMYVAYNQFYQPQLGQVEKRNASPDRAHNETWDSIVITGFSGLLVYLSIFSAVFYYGLKWQDLIKTNRNIYSFFACLIGGGLIGSIMLILLKGIEYLGVGLPLGMLVGLVVYITGYALYSFSIKDEYNRNNPYLPVLIVLFSAIVGHFVEINFGIAIVATRTLFWTYAGLILVIGFILPTLIQESTQVLADENKIETKNYLSNRKKGRISIRRSRRTMSKSQRPLIGDKPDWFRNALIGAIMMGIILATLGYDYVTNSIQSTSFIEIIINSLTRLANQDNRISLGILLIVIIPTAIAGILLFAIESDEISNNHAWMQSLGLITIVSIFIGVFFWVLHAVSLAILASSTPANQNDVISKVNSIGSLLTKYYLYIFLILLVLAFVLPHDWPVKSKSSSALGGLLIPVGLILVFAFTNLSNLRVIHADITFKMAEPFTKNGRWDVATFLYKRSLELTPQEDHYYLFLGRSYLEQAKTTDTTTDQDNLVLQAEKDLKVAQSINPLNTDHTANLARLYSWWAGKATTAATRDDRSQKASDYYATAVLLSPNNSTLWDEWAILFMQLIGNPQQALDRLQHALQLDPKFSYTQGLLGDYYLRIANSSNDIQSKEQALQTAAGYYNAAADVAKSTDPTSKASYLVSLGNVYSMLAVADPQNVDREQLQLSINALLESIDAGLSSSDLWKIQEAIAKLYLQMQDKKNAQYYANQALINAPSSMVSGIQDLITQTQSLP
jgi:O-antigen ligase/NADH:ubiquinone oxidoreductase subunit 6 (subunit J)